MGKANSRAPQTPATLFLERSAIHYSVHFYAYEAHGGTAVSARELALPEHAIVKTLVMQDEHANPLVVLMHGDLKVSTRKLARTARCKRIEPCTPAAATRHTGYLVGGTSPFGMRRKIPVFMESSILDLPLVYINGGRRGFLVGIAPGEILRALNPCLVKVAIES